MSEGSSAVAIAQGVDAGHVGAQLIIHTDITALIRFDSRVLQTEVRGVRHAAYCEKRMRPYDRPIAADAVDIDGYLLAALFQRDAFSAQPHLDAFSFEDCPDGFGNVLVFTLNQARPHLDDRHLAAEAAVHLSKLQTDIAAANDD